MELNKTTSIGFTTIPTTRNWRTNETFQINFTNNSEGYSLYELETKGDQEFPFDSSILVLNKFDDQLRLTSRKTSIYREPVTRVFEIDQQTYTFYVAGTYAPYSSGFDSGFYLDESNQKITTICRVPGKDVDGNETEITYLAEYSLELELQYVKIISVGIDIFFSGRFPSADNGYYIFFRQGFFNSILAKFSEDHVFERDYRVSGVNLIGIQEIDGKLIGLSESGPLNYRILELLSNSYITIRDFEIRPETNGPFGFDYLVSFYGKDGYFAAISNSGRLYFIKPGESSYVRGILHPLGDPGHFTPGYKTFKLYPIKEGLLFTGFIQGHNDQISPISSKYFVVGKLDDQGNIVEINALDIRYNIETLFSVIGENGEGQHLVGVLTSDYTSEYIFLSHDSELEIITDPSNN